MEKGTTSNIKLGSRCKGHRDWLVSIDSYRVSSKTVCTCSLFVNCASHQGPIIKWSIYFFSWIKIDAKFKIIDLEMTEIIDSKVETPLCNEAKSAIKMILSKSSLSHVLCCNLKFFSHRKESKVRF